MRIPNFRRSLLAVLLGSIIYFAIAPHLPGALQHRFDRFDFGLFFWFLICAVLYWAFGVLLRHHGRYHGQARQ
jgi:hypothetical protein